MLAFIYQNLGTLRRITGIKHGSPLLNDTEEVPDAADTDEFEVNEPDEWWDAFTIANKDHCDVDDDK